MIDRNHSAIDLASLYISGLQIYLNDQVSSITGPLVSAGECRDDTNSFNMSTNGIFFDPNKIGVNGKDTPGPTIQGNFLYSVFLIGDSSGEKETACILTIATNNSPWMPSGYNIKRKIGYLMSFNNGSGLEFQNCFNIGSSNDRKLRLCCSYADYQLLDEEEGYVFCDLTSYVPPVANTPIYLFLNFQPSVAGNGVLIQNDKYNGQSDVVPYTSNITSQATFNNDGVIGIMAGSREAGNITTLSFLGFDYYV